MRIFIIAFAIASVSVSLVASAGPKCEKQMITDIAEVRKWLQNVHETLLKMNNENVQAEWNWNTDISKANEDKKAITNAKMAAKYKELWAEAACVDCETANCTDQEKRRVASYNSIDTSALPEKKYDDYGVISTTMKNIYSTAEVCRPDGSACMRLDPDLSELLETSRDYCDLQWAWEGWRNQTGRKIRGFYTSYVLMQNEAAELNGFPSAKDMWTKSYLRDEKRFFDQIEEAWQKVKPLYQELHAYVRSKMAKLYPAKSYPMPASGHIPAHLFGNMWAQDWTALYDVLVPHPNAPAVDITKLLIEKKWTEMDLHYESDRFFQSIGLDKMTDDFWKNSVFLRKPKPTEMVCHASAWNFYTDTDFRVKMCTVLTSGDFQTVHHEMGHIQYYMQYKKQPVEFRTGANPGFHEAIGDLIALSVMTPGHLKAIGMLPADFKEDEQTSLNALMSMALQKVPFLPFGYLMDKYRWSIFERNTSFSDLNKAWWDLRCDMQGVSPPVPRSEEDFDAGAKYHIPASTPYIRYFFSHIAQFQFHKAICQQMGYKDNYHKCDIYNNKDATKGFRDAMALGASEPYPKVMKTLTGSEDLDASAIIDYFAPLYDWLKKENAKAGVKVGWEPVCSPVKRNTCNYNRSKAPTPDNSSLALKVSPILLGIAVAFQMI